MSSTTAVHSTITSATHTDKDTPMRSNQLMSLKAELNSLNLTAPADIQKYESIIESVAALPSSEGKRNLNGINTSKDVAAEIEKRALDAALSKERVNQARLMTDAAHKAIDSPRE